MGVIAIPEDVAAHLQAAIQLSNRRVQIRLLHEAEALLAQELPIAALVIANAVLESVLEVLPQERYSDHAAEIERWRKMRNIAAHSAPSELSLDQATEMVRRIRDLLIELMPVTDTGPVKARVTVNQLRGKYKLVPTSSTAFIERKANELGLEHQ